jgi:UDP-arabinose 4-epimerase
MRILVTGGAGYVGSHACKALAAARHEPITYDNLCNGRREAVRWGPLENGDIGDRSRLDAVMSRYRPEAVLHFAAFAYVGESVTEPAKYYRNNVAGTLSLLEAMRSHAVRRIVFSSTCAVYGVPQTVPIPEDAPAEPVNPYGASKLMIERMLADFERAYGLRYASLRYFNAAGADLDCEIGEAHEPETHLIPLALQTALGRHASVRIYGNDYATQDGTCIRDYVHVTDLAEAHVRALSHLQESDASLTLNLGSGNGHSVREVIEMSRKVTGRDIPEVIASRRPGDPPVLVARPGRAEQVLGWVPRYSDLETIVSSAWAWQRKSEQLKQT